MKSPADLEVATDLADLELDHQVGHPGAFLEAVRVVGQGVDVGFDVDV
jgi:hypothetical protein